MTQYDARLVLTTPAIVAERVEEPRGELLERPWPHPRGEGLMGTLRWEKESAERHALEVATFGAKLANTKLEAEEAEPVDEPAPVVVIPQRAAAPPAAAVP